MIIEPNTVSPLPSDLLSWARTFVDWHGFRADYAERLDSCRRLLRDARNDRDAAERLGDGVAATGYRIAQERYETRLVEINAMITTCDAYVSALASLVTMRKMSPEEEAHNQLLVANLKAFAFNIKRVREVNDALEREVKAAQSQQQVTANTLEAELARARRDLEKQQAIIDKLLGVPKE